MKSNKDIAELLDEPACEHNNQSKSGRAKPKPGASAGGCAFDGAQIALLPIVDVAHIVPFDVVLCRLCFRASIITLVLLGFLANTAFALPREPTWGDELETGAFALDNRRGPNPVYRFAPVNPGIGSPGGRLESDGGSATGNYHLAIPLLDFPGRGLNLSLTAHYNSQIWTKSSTPKPGKSQFSYGVDGDWPVPGWNFGFGKLVFPRNSMFIDPSGTRRPISRSWVSGWNNGIPTGPVRAKFLDGSLSTVECPVKITFPSQAHWCDSNGAAVVTLDDGISMIMHSTSGEDASGARVYYPVTISDANGNFVQIDYRLDASGTPTGPDIDRITDSVGRVVQYHYDNRGLPIAISGPGNNGGTHVYVRFYYRQHGSTVSAPIVPGVNETLNLNFPVLEAIVFPGNGTGYVFSEFTPFGIAKTVNVNRNMTVSTGSLTEQGSFGFGINTQRSTFDYSDDPLALVGFQLPSYSHRTDTWVDLVSGNSQQATTAYTYNVFNRSTTTIAPDGSSTVQQPITDPDRPGYGLINWSRTVGKDGKLLRTTHYIWEEAGPSWRQKEVRITDHEINAVKRVEFRYGANNRQVTEEIHHDYAAPDKLDQAPVVYHKVVTYRNDPQYLARGFNLVSATSLLNGKMHRNPAYDPYLLRLQELKAQLEEAQTKARDPQQAVGVAQRAVDDWKTREPAKVIREPDNPRPVPNPDWNVWAEQMSDLAEALGREQANAAPTQTALKVAQANYDAAAANPPPQTIETEIERTTFEYDAPNLLSVNPKPSGYSPSIDPFMPRGLVSTVTRWLAADSKTISEAAGSLRGVSTHYTYDETGNLRVVRDSPTSETRYIYDSATNYSLPSSITYGSSDPGSPVRNKTSILYDLGLGLPTKTTDENNNPTDITYEPGTSGWRIKSVKTATGAKVTLDYDDQYLSIASKVVDAEGGVYDQTARYDGRGLLRDERVRRRTEGGHDITEHQYDTMGRMIKKSLPRRTTESEVTQWIDYVYDNAGRLAAITDPTAATITKRFFNESAKPSVLPVDALGPTVRAVGPWEHESWTMLDALGQPRYVVSPNPATGKVSDPGSQLTEEVHDARGLLTESFYGSQLRSFHYDSLGRLTAVRVPERNATLDILGNHSRSEGSYTDVYQYDDRNLVSHIDPRGVKTIFDYANDPLNRLQSVSYDLSRIGDASSAIEPAARTSFDYVQIGDRRRPENVTTAGIVQQHFNYGPFGRLTGVTTKFDAAPNSPLETSMQFDSLNRPTWFRYPGRYENGQLQGVNQLDYSYSKDGELDWMKLDGRAIVDNIRYGTAGIKHLSLFIQGLEISEDYDYDPRTGRLNKQSITNVSNSQQKLLDLSYDYLLPQVPVQPGQPTPAPGQTGQITKRANLLGNQDYVSHAYDGWGRLISATQHLGLFDTNRQNYSYDIYGNRTDVKAQQWSPGRGVGWVDLPDNSADGMKTPVIGSSNRIQAAGYHYDDAGNLVHGPGVDGQMQRYRYDAAERLVRVEDDNGKLIEAYQYGADRRRVGVSADQRNWRLSVWNDNTEVARYDLQAGTGSLNWVDMPIYFGSRLLAELQHTQSGTTQKMFHPDQRDSVLTTEVVGGTLQARAQSVLPYGAENTPATQIDGDRRFTSYRRSDRTGLDYAINRFYDPKLGRFIQPDPAMSDGNFYVYAGGDPVNQIDPIGLRWIYAEVCLNGICPGGQWYWHDDPVGIEQLAQQDRDRARGAGSGDRGGGGGASPGASPGEEPRVGRCPAKPFKYKYDGSLGGATWSPFATLKLNKGKLDAFVLHGYEAHKGKLATEYVSLRGFSSSGAYSGTIFAGGVEVNVKAGHAAFLRGVEQINGDNGSHHVEDIYLAEVGLGYWYGGWYGTSSGESATGVYGGIRGGSAFLGAGLSTETLVNVLAGPLELMLYLNTPNCE